MKKLGVLGRGISYSLSPEIHKSFAKEHGIDIVYEIFDIPTDPIGFIENFFKQGGIGLNITKPYKEIAAKKFSRDLNSVNCLYGKPINSSSTDGAGLIADLKSKNIETQDKNVLVWGMGGAGISIVKEFSQNQITFIANRSKEKLSMIHNSFSNVEEYANQEIDLLIMCVQDIDQNTEKQIKKINLSKDAYIYDINYAGNTFSKIETLELVPKGRIFNGLGMLVEQAAESYRLWFNYLPSTENIKNLLNERL